MFTPLLFCTLSLLTLADVVETTTGDIVEFQADDMDSSASAVVSFKALLAPTSAPTKGTKGSSATCSLKVVVETSPDGDVFFPVGATEIIKGQGEVLDIIPVKLLLSHVRVRLEVRGLRVSATVRLHTNEELHLVQRAGSPSAALEASPSAAPEASPSAAPEAASEASASATPEA